MLDTKMIISEIDVVLKKYEECRASSKYDDLSDLKRAETNEILTLLEAAIERAAPPGSIYKRHAEGAYAKYGHDNSHNITILTGVLRAIRADYDAGRLQGAIELIHADLFSDFLEMAEHLLGEGFKDPAAVLAGGVLEGHLRQLAPKYSVAVVDSKGQPKKADLLNAELSAAGAYGKGDLKNITAWLHLRNSAAHGKYGDYTKEQVALLTQSVRDFITRIPA